MLIIIILATLMVVAKIVANIPITLFDVTNNSHSEFLQLNNRASFIQLIILTLSFPY